MKSLNKNLIISRSVFLLLIVFCINSYAKFHDIYNIVNPSFNYHIEGNKYRVILKDTGYVSLRDNGFRFFLPKLVKDYNLELLRVSSIGYLDGYLSKNKYIDKKNILNIGFIDLNYYLTDYNEQNQRQLDYILNDKIIPYKKSTSLIIEGYNIPLSISNKLDKWLYFTFKKTSDSRLKEMSYTFNMTFDKNEIDAYVKNNLIVKNYDKTEYTYIDAYLNNLTKKKNIFYEPIKKVKIIAKKSVNKTKKKTIKKKSKYYLDIKRITNYINIDGIKNNENDLLKALNKPENQNIIGKVKFNLGVHSLRSKKRVDKKKSFQYFKESKEKEAYFNLGIFYYIGLFVKENDKIAYTYFNKSSNLGFSRAEKNINIMKEYKVGTN